MTHPSPTTGTEPLTAGPSGTGGNLCFSSLVTHLERQLELYRHLLVLGQRIQELLQAQRGEELSNLMDQRQEMVDRLCEIDVQLQQYRMHWNQWFSRLPSTDRERIDRLTRSLEQLRDQVRVMDQAQIRLLRDQRDRLGRDLSTMEQANRAIRSYQRLPDDSLPPSTDHRG